MFSSKGHTAPMATTRAYPTLQQESKHSNVNNTTVLQHNSIYTNRRLAGFGTADAQISSPTVRGSSPNSLAQHSGPKPPPSHMPTPTTDPQSHQPPLSKTQSLHLTSISHSFRSVSLGIKWRCRIITLLIVRNK